MNYFDILLAKKLRGGGGGDITIKSLNVTQNGTYSEEGVAYSPVKVNVPLPENAYLLKDIPNTPTAIATFSDGANLPMPKLEVAIEPQQDLHGYDSPWVGGAGKNKLQVTATTTTKDGITFTVKEDGTIVITGTKSSSASTRIWFDIAFNISFSYDVILNGCPSGGDSTTYKLAGFVGGTGTGDYNDVGNGVTIPANTMLNTISIGIAQQGNINLVFKPMIRLASVQDATFAPYSNICPISGWDEVVVTVADDAESPTTSHEYTIDLDGTRYGGTLDVVSGELVVDRVGVDMGSLDWTNGGAMQMFFSVGIRDLVKKPSSNDEIANVLSDRFEATSYNELSLSTIGKVCISASGSVGIVDGNTYTSVTDFKTAMNGVQLVYELATPQTIQLTPTVVKSLRGMNNVFADSGNILDLSYLAKEE